MNQQFVDVLKTFNNSGLFAAAAALLKMNKVKQEQYRCLKITFNDVHLLNRVEQRIAKTYLILSTKTKDTRFCQFTENILGFQMALDAAKKYVSNKNTKTRHYCVYLSYDDDVEKSQYFTIHVKNPKTNEAILTSTISCLV